MRVLAPSINVELLVLWGWNSAGELQNMKCNLWDSVSRSMCAWRTPAAAGGLRAAAACC